MKIENDVPWWVTNTPGARKKELMEQRIIREICLILPKQQAELIVVGYMNGDKQCKEFFERMSRRLPQSDRRPDGWRRAGSIDPRGDA